MIANKKDFSIPRVDPVKFVEKANGAIKGYAVNTFHGMVKDYNQDRVSIIMNITKPNFKGRWPKCSYFGVFDGHGGDACSNFLKDNMHKYITENQYFPLQPIEALKTGFKKAEAQFIRYAQSQNPPQRSGSCAIVILIIDQVCYIANVGDSRAILSCERGSKIFSLSYDHKPDSPMERARIQKANGKIYQSIIKTKNGINIPGPYRINPGKLSVSRSFGDIEAKLQKYGGNPKVLIAKPEITYFEINFEIHDFIVIGSDGIYDKLSNEQIAECFWDRHSQRKGNYDYIGEASSKILTQSMNRMSMDNITSLIIVFEDHGRLDLPRKRMNKYVEQSAENRQNKMENKQDYKTEKQNCEKDLINGMKSDREASSKLIEKMTMRRKSATHTSSAATKNNENKNEEVKKDREEKQKERHDRSTKHLRKDNTMKVLPTHKIDKQVKEKQYKQLKDLKEEKGLYSLAKILKTRNIDKIR